MYVQFLVDYNIIDMSAIRIRITLADEELQG